VGWKYNVFKESQFLNRLREVLNIRSPGEFRGG